MQRYIWFLLYRYSSSLYICPFQESFWGHIWAIFLCDLSLLNCHPADPDRLPPHAGRHLCRGPVRCGRGDHVPGTVQGPQGAALPLQEEEVTSNYFEFSTVATVYKVAIWAAKCLQKRPIWAAKCLLYIRINFIPGLYCNTTLPHSSIH